MNILFIMRVKILMFIKCSYRCPNYVYKLDLVQFVAEQSVTF